MGTIDTHARGSEGYPARLEALRDPPARVFSRGTLPRAPAVAIVGTRRADAEAVDFTEHLARELAGAGLSIVSGGAAGIDAAAHRGAILAGGHTIVVQAASLAEPYPGSHRALFDEILTKGGGWISETPIGMPAQAYRFLARNRLIAALADVVVVVQAPAKSGALSTARHARQLGRPLFAVPAAPWDPRSEGVLTLLAELARVCRGADDIATFLGVARRDHVEAPKEAHPPLGPDAERVLAALSTRPAHADAIATRAGLPIARAHVALIQLATHGRARQQHGAWRVVG
jgi:DNA processing protein